MTKKYIITDDKVLSNIDQSSTNPVKSSALYTALDGKVDKVTGKQLSTEDFTTELKTKLDGIESGAEVNVQANWTETDTTADAYIANKPFVSIGSGLTVTNNVLTANEQLHFRVFDTLPAASAEYAQVIALVLKTATETGNLYNEYACVNTGSSASPSWKWEQIGESKFELTITQTASGITINTTALQSATSAQTGLLTAADFATFNGKQDALTFDDTPTASSTNPVKSSGIKTELDKKVNIAQGVAEKGKFLIIGDDGNVAPTTYTPSSPAWGEITGTLANQTDLNAALAGKVATSVKVGSSALTADVTAAALSADIKDVTETLTNKTISADTNTISALETDNFKSGVIVTAFQTTPTDTALPTEKLVKDSLDKKLDVDQTGTVTAFHIGCDANGYYLEEDA